MSLELVVAAALFLGILAYAVLAGADFGSGFYDLTAGGARRGAELRTLVDHSIGPVWEANHVWLIYILVVWWTGFPTTFAAAMTTLTLPMFFALLGIVLRGASFGFRKFAATLDQARLFGVIFASSSVITPFFLGAAVGGIASGRVPAGGYGDPITSWVNPTSIFGGLIAVGTCAFLAGAFLTADAERSGHASLAESLRIRTLGVGLATGVLVFVALVPLLDDAPTLTHGLRTQAAPLIVLAAMFGVSTMWLLWFRRYSPARFTAVAAVVSVISGWGIGQYPWFLVDQVKIADAGGAHATLWGLIIVVVLAGVLVLPPLVYLLRFTQTEPQPHPVASPVVSSAASPGASPVASPLAAAGMSGTAVAARPHARPGPLGLLLVGAAVIAGIVGARRKSDG